MNALRLSAFLSLVSISSGQDGWDRIANAQERFARDQATQGRAEAVALTSPPPTASKPTFSADEKLRIDALLALSKRCGTGSLRLNESLGLYVPVMREGCK